MIPIEHKASWNLYGADT